MSLRRSRSRVVLQGRGTPGDLEESFGSGYNATGGPGAVEVGAVRVLNQAAHIAAHTAAHIAAHI
jgi:hypothetical protein